VIFDWDTLKEASVPKNWAAQVMYGSTQDGPIHLILQSMTSDLNPPTKTYFEKVITTSGEVLLGDKKA